MRPSRLLVLFALLAAGCADGPRDRFAAEVVPLLEARCASTLCHGVGPGQEWPEADGLFVEVDARGRIADVDRAREIALARVSVRAPLASSLVRVPSPRWAGGGPHAGGAVLLGPDDPATERIALWIEREAGSGARGGEDLALSALEAQFGAEVLPELNARCGRDGCHGPSDVAFSTLGSRTGADGSFTDAEIRRARRAARKMLDLWGADPRRSRLFRKAIGAVAGGLVHRGGASTFFPEAPLDAPFESPALQSILRWSIAEREAIGAGGVPAGVVFVAGPPSARAPWRIEPGELGSDLYLAGWPEPGAPVALTEGLHPEGPVEIRDAAVSHDGERVAFAMRRASERDFALYELSLADRSARRLTAEGTGSYVQPVYAPDARVIAAWDGHGERGADGEGVAPELIAVDLVDGTTERLTFTPAPEVAPGVLAAGKTRGQVVFGTRREGARGPEAVLFRFPLCHDPGLHGEPEYHVQFGASLAPLAPLVARDLPDGRQAMIVLPGATADDDAGALVLLDRSLGPDTPAAEVSVGGYRRPIAVLDADARYRDVAALPDGRLLASTRDELQTIEIRDGLDGAHILQSATWLAMPGRAIRSPAIVLARPQEDDDHEPVVDPSLDRGRLALRDVAVLEALFGRAEPTGSRALRSEIAGLRLLASERAPAEQGTAGLSSRVPARVLGEIDLEADRSAWLDIPARTPILIQLLDARGMEVGRSLDRWYFAEGGETVPGGTNEATYGHACAGCHGSLSGDPREATAPEPDALSSASVTLSTYAERDRRRPMPARAMGAAERVDYRASVRPIVLALCLECHDGASAEGGLDLSERAGARFDAGYEALSRHVDLVTLRARRSPLIERLTGLELEAPERVSGRCPPGGASDDVVRVMSRWIEAGAFYDLGGP
ncbi:MAG: hypothetical protein IT378_17825 [Sandaracinaceae bacterium]|nr:hypothetical protein [Sandaracinaceae bacterium]